MAIAACKKKGQLEEEKEKSIKREKIRRKGLGAARASADVDGLLLFSSAALRARGVSLQRPFKLSLTAVALEIAPRPTPPWTGAAHSTSGRRARPLHAIGTIRIEPWAPNYSARRPRKRNSGSRIGGACVRLGAKSSACSDASGHDPNVPIDWPRPTLSNPNNHGTVHFLWDATAALVPARPPQRPGLPRLQ